MRARRSAGRTFAERDLDLAALAVAEDLHRHHVPRLVGGDYLREIVGLDDLAAVDGEDHVAPRFVLRGLEAEIAVAPAQAGFLRGAAGDDFGDQAAVVGVEAELAGELWVEGLRRDPDVGVFGLAGALELGQ